MADAVKKVGGIRNCVERRVAEKTMGGSISMNSCSAPGPIFISIIGIINTAFFALQTTTVLELSTH